MTKVKICGCRTPADALAAAEAGADFVGIVFAESPRRVSVEEGGAIVRALGSPLGAREVDSPPALFRADGSGLRSWYEQGAAGLERMLARKRPLTVGVFADAEPEEVDETADEAGLDLVQLSGSEDWGACLLINRQVIKAVHVGSEESAQSALARIEGGSAIAVLLDTADAQRRGGTGRTLDWGVAREIAASVPVWLAGGLTPENLATAIASVRPWCVDVSSGVETGGVKDYAKVRQFVDAARRL